MKNLYLTLFLLSLTILTKAQEFDIREFKTDLTDLSAQRSPRMTVNGDRCAIVKIVTNIKGMQFDSNIGIVDEPVHTEDGYWLYVSPREKAIKLMATGFLSVEVPLPEPAKSNMVYKLVVAAKGLIQTTDLVKITFRISESDVYIRSGNMAPILSSGNSAVFNVPKGEHSYRFIKQGFKEEEKKFTVENEEVFDITMVPGATSTKMALSGNIVVTSEPEGADVYLNDQRIGKTPYQGKHIAGKYTLRVMKNLYYDDVQEFELAETATNNIPTIKLKPRFGYWQVSTSPSEAEILLDGKPVGTSPLSNAQIASGNHELTVRKSLYYEHKENFTVNDGEEKKLNITLKEAFGSLSITSDPAGAKVFIDNREVGTTPYEAKQIASGTYQIRLTADLFSDTEEQVVISDGKPTKKYISLSKNFGTLVVSAPEADIYLNNNKVGTGKYKGNIQPGEYTLKATRDKHKDAEREVFITLGQTDSVYLEPIPRQGGIAVTTTPFEALGADIYINNQKQKAVTPATIALLVGSYDVKVKKSGYLEASKTVVVKEGTEIDVPFELKTYKGSMLQTAKKYKRQRFFWGTLTTAAIGTGAYFSLSVLSMSNEYKTATTNATSLYKQMQQNNLYSLVAYGVAVPLGVITLVKSSKYKKAKRDVNLSVLPVKEGLLFGMVKKF